MQNRHSVWACATIMAFAFSTPAQADVDGAYDHADIPRVAGSSIVYFDRTEFDRATIPTGPYDDGEVESAKTMEGEILSLSYTFDNPDISTLQIKRNYIQALEDRGFELLYTASGSDLSSGAGRSFFVHGTDIFSRGARGCCRLATRTSNRDLRYIAAISGDGTVLAGIAAFNARRVDGPAVSMAVVTSDEMDTEMDHQPLTASEMEAGLIEEGRVAVQDILFEFDSARILPESSDALATVAGLMRDLPDMNLLVVGHTDNSGSYDYNLSLSMERATSVVSYLTRQHGVSGDRLDPAGAGMMAPISTNRTEQGRSLNRRVELVEMQR
ncbi:OmpA family protein [Roseinatronobacter sp. S2]|uniref:OmpA family protein n=1 Tax=Roseinatronobacter sp. S2 TaxID=3035471 RepID=UPI00240F4542|nr:OmpA family protein [Roseinatronobacter sp. S2]WFE75867.1 OmpA family protein [Roseinatronobacter sp. S2]